MDVDMNQTWWRNHKKSLQWMWHWEDGTGNAAMWCYGCAWFQWLNWKLLCPMCFCAALSYFVNGYRTFSRFQLCQACYEDSLYPELCIDSCHDFGADRPELAAVVKYGAWLQILGHGRQILTPWRLMQDFSNKGIMPCYQIVPGTRRGGSVENRPWL